MKKQEGGEPADNEAERALLMGVLRSELELVHYYGTC